MIMKIFSFAALMVCSLLMSGNAYAQKYTKTDSEMGIVKFMDVTEIDDMEEWQSIRKFCDSVYKKEGFVKAGQRLVMCLKDFKSDDADVLYDIAKYVSNSKNNMYKYNMSLVSKANMNNMAELLAESYNLSALDIELNALRVQFAIQAAQLGHEGAANLLKTWQLQNQINNQNSNFGNGYNNGYSTGGNNEARKKQLLDNIATYEKRILEIERQKGSGIATNMMGNQTISNYNRMIQDAKRELRSMGYNIY